MLNVLMRRSNRIDSRYSYCDYGCYAKGTLKNHIEEVHESRKSQKHTGCDISCLGKI